MEKTVPAFNRLKDISMDKADFFLYPMLFRIGSGDLQGPQGEIGRPYLYVGPFLGESDGNDAAARSEIENADFSLWGLRLDLSFRLR